MLTDFKLYESKLGNSHIIHFLDAYGNHGF
jgi:hypothetical protein